MSPRNHRRSLGAAALAITLGATLAGCGQAPWLALSSSTPTPTSSSVKTPTPTPTIATVVNELATGSAEHKLQAGDVALTAKYWSTLSMDQWTAEANKPISFSLQGVLGTDDGQAVYLSRVSVAPAVGGPTGELPSISPLTDQASIAPGYSIKSPYSYSQTFILPAVDPKATSITLSFTYEVLIQTTPTSTDYAKQTASDQITIAIAK
jgi:hypothetical protein